MVMVMFGHVYGLEGKSWGFRLGIRMTHDLCRVRVQGSALRQDEFSCSGIRDLGYGREGL